MIAVVLDGMDLTDVQTADHVVYIGQSRCGPQPIGPCSNRPSARVVARMGAAGRGPIRALHLRGETVKRVSLIGRNSGGPLCRSQ